MPTGFGTYMADLGMQAGQGLLGGAMGLILEKHNDRRQLEQQGKLQAIQEASNLRIGKEMRDYNNMKDLEMWKATNYSAQKDEIKKAGLNPALLYGMKGGGGVTIGSSGSASGVSGASAPTGGREAVESAGMALQLGLLRAQKENIEADTANKKADAGYTEGAKTANTQADTANKITENAQRAIDLAFQKETFEDRDDAIMIALDQAKQDLDRGENQKTIELATRNATIDEIKNRFTQAILQNALISANTDQSKAATDNIRQQIIQSKEQIKKWSQEIAQGWDSNDIRAFEAEIRASFPGIGQSFGNILMGGLEELREAIGDKGPDRVYKMKRERKK